MKLVEDSSGVLTAEMPSNSGREVTSLWLVENIVDKGRAWCVVGLGYSRQFFDRPFLKGGDLRDDVAVGAYQLVLARESVAALRDRVDLWMRHREPFHLEMETNGSGGVDFQLEAHGGSAGSKNMPLFAVTISSAGFVAEMSYMVDETCVRRFRGGFSRALLSQ